MAWAEGNQKCDPDDLRHLIHDTAAYRDRAGHTGPEPLGRQPAHDNPLREIHHYLAKRLEQPAPSIADARLSI